MIRVVRIGEPGDLGLPPGCGDRNSEVVERGATADQRLPAGPVGDHRPFYSEKQLELARASYPLPGLAVMQ